MVPLQLEWMHWSQQTVMLWIAFGIILLTMGLLDIRFGSDTRKGWLPYPTSRGDRLFLALMVMVGIGVVWLRFVRYDMDITMWVPFVVSFVTGAIVMRYF